MLRKSVLFLVIVSVFTSLLATSASAHKFVDTRAVVKDHQHIGNNGILGAPAGQIAVKYRAVYWRTRSALGETGYIRPDRIRFRQKQLPIWKNGLWPFGIQKVIYHIRVVDDLNPPLIGSVTKQKVWMYPSYYSKTFDFEGKARSVLHHPRVCVRVQFKIFLNPDHHESMKCKEMT